MSPIANTIKQAFLLFLVGILPAVGSGASAAMIALMLSVDYAMLAPVCGVVCGLVMRFVAPGQRTVGALVSVALATVAFASGAIVRGVLRIAIEMSERPPDVLAKLDWSLAGYMVLASLRSNRWVAAAVSLALAYLVVQVTMGHLGRNAPAKESDRRSG